MLWNVPIDDAKRLAPSRLDAFRLQLLREAMPRRSTGVGVDIPWGEQPEASAALLRLGHSVRHFEVSLTPKTEDSFQVRVWIYSDKEVWPAATGVHVFRNDVSDAYLMKQLSLATRIALGYITHADQTLESVFANNA